MYTRRLEQRQRQEATLHPEPLALPGASKGTTAASLSGTIWLRTSCQGAAATSCWTPRNCGAQGVGSHQGTACARVQCAGATAGRGCNQGTACARVQCAGATAGRGCNQGTACARTSLRTLLTRACNQGTACAVERSWTGYRTPWWCALGGAEWCRVRNPPRSPGQPPLDTP